MAKCYKCLDTGQRDFVDDQGRPYFSTCSCDAGRAKSGNRLEMDTVNAAGHEPFVYGMHREGNPEYDEYRHDPDSIGFDDSYTGPSELELGGGCNRCGAPDDCYCNG